MLKLAIGCGGTGGHFYPGLSLARELQAQGGEALLLLSGVNGKSQAEAAAHCGVRAVELPLMPSPRGLGGGCRFIHGLCSGFFTAKKELKRFAPDAVIGMGSFASLPVILAARWLRLKIYLHDGNVRIGRANRLLSRLAVRVLGAFPPVNAAALRAPFELVGMPMRPELLAFTGTRGEAAALLNEKYGWTLSPEKPTLLVMGGSQGARAINVAVAAAVAELKKTGADFQLIHLAGVRLAQETGQLYSTLNCEVFMLPSSQEMAWIYACSDAVLCRSGGSTVAELATFGKYGILCPYPYAAELHQNDNAKLPAASGAAELILNSALSVPAVREIFSRILGDLTEYRRRGAAGATELHRRAAGAIIDLLSAGPAR
ncbi:MAG: UDP-N-acetylglucosamine--N-acetylmuramyl-(pentapeptide) pyrophosphoryl-undecaprenol N-acetylglucosamine transferase [Victivallaceae bacterium]|nr:UDP-N-acetylglucosamine--N-acetylmuramyl-(pentapeptide) pyrophosphoryl-undecaprenol N-acetylglucosamine transferase [Victivallaceae bacterium]